MDVRASCSDKKPFLRLRDAATMLQAGNKGNSCNNSRNNSNRFRVYSNNRKNSNPRNNGNMNDSNTCQHEISSLQASDICT